MDGALREGALIEGAATDVCVVVELPFSLCAPTDLSDASSWDCNAVEYTEEDREAADALGFRPPGDVVDWPFDSENGRKASGCCWSKEDTDGAVGERCCDRSTFLKLPR